MRTVALEIAGNKYRVTTDADAQNLERLAAELNGRIERLGAKVVRTATPAQLLAVIALNLAEELEASRSENAALKQGTRAAAEEALFAIESELSKLASIR